MSHTSPTSPSPTFEYRHTAVWTPLGGLVATGFLLGCAITAKSVGQAILLLLATGVLLLLATGVFGWAATLFYEAVKLRIERVAGEITWERQSIRSFRLAHVERTYPLSALSVVWLEQTRSSNYRVLLNVGKEWLPLSRAFTNDGSPQVEYERLLEWLEAQGIPVRKDSGLLTEGPAGDEVRVVI